MSDSVMPLTPATWPADTTKPSGKTAVVGAAAALPAIATAALSVVSASPSATVAEMLTAPAAAVMVSESKLRFSKRGVPVRVRPPSSSSIMPTPVGNTDTANTPLTGVKRTVRLSLSRSVTLKPATLVSKPANKTGIALGTAMLAEWCSVMATSAMPLVVVPV